MRQQLLGLQIDNNLGSEPEINPGEIAAGLRRNKGSFEEESMYRGVSNP